MAFEILQVAGFKTLNDKEKVKIDWTAIHDYCKKNEERIRALFDVERKMWKETLTPDEKKSLNLYINHKLDKMLSIQIKAQNTRRLYFTLEYKFKWIGKQVFDSVNINTKDSILTEADLISDDENELLYTRYISTQNVTTTGLDKSIFLNRW